MLLTADLYYISNVKKLKKLNVTLDSFDTGSGIDILNIILQTEYSGMIAVSVCFVALVLLHGILFNLIKPKESKKS